MSIIRIRKKTQNFSVLYNVPFRDRRLSLEARGLLAFLLTKRDDWSLDTKALIGESPNAGRDKILRILREFKEFGFLHRQKWRAEDGQWDWETIIYETPADNPHFKGNIPSLYTENPAVRNSETSPPYTENPFTAGPQVIDSKESPYTENPAMDDDGLETDFQDSEYRPDPPCTEKPYTAQPYTENQSIVIRTDLIRTDLKSIEKSSLAGSEQPAKGEGGDLQVQEEKNSPPDKESILRKSISALTGKGRKKVAAVTDQEWADINEVFIFWRDERKKSLTAKLTPERGRNVLDRLRGLFTVEDLKKAVQGVRFSAHHMGNNERGTIYDDLELICRDDQRSESLRELAEEALRNGNSNQNLSERNRGNETGGGAVAGRMLSDDEIRASLQLPNRDQDLRRPGKEKNAGV